MQVKLEASPRDTANVQSLLPKLLRQAYHVKYDMFIYKALVTLVNGMCIGHLGAFI